MLAVNANLLAASEAGTGTPIFYITLQRYDGITFTNLGNYNVIEATLTRMKYTIRVHEDLVSSPFIVTTSGDPYLIAVTRGLSVNGVAYTYTSRNYFVSSAVYLANDGYTTIIADLLSYNPIYAVTANVIARTVLDNALTQVFIDDFTYDALRDIWFDWKFYPDFQTLSLFDARSLEDLVANKYFSYFFPRSDGLHCYSAASNSTNNYDGSYTPFAGAKVKKTVMQDQRVNLTWVDEIGKKYNIISVTYPFHSLGFIPGSANPTAIADFIIWSSVFPDTTYEITQRVDFRLEQGDLIFLPYNANVHCIDLEEHFKTGKNPEWSQIIRELPYHPEVVQYALIKFPPFTDPGAPHRHRQRQIIADGFENALSVGDQDMQTAFDTLDDYCRLDGWLPAGQAWTYNTSSSVVVPAGAALRYSVGDKIKFEQVSAGPVITQKYFSVIAVADTVLSIYAGLTHVVTNDPIQNIFYSKQDHPVGFPAYFDWSGASGINAQGFSAFTVHEFNFRISGRIMYCRLNISGTSNATTFTGTLPLIPALVFNWIFRSRDNSAAYNVGVMVNAAAALTLYPAVLTTTAWTNANTKACINLYFFYYF